jgi:hypothetical protein
MLVRKLGSETHEGKHLDIMQCSRMHPNRTIIITQVICIYKSITINIIMLVRKHTKGNNYKLCSAPVCTLTEVSLLQTDEQV